MSNIGPDQLLTYRGPREFRHRESSVSSTYENVKEDIRQTVGRLETLLFEDLPEWCQDNPYVRSGYRRIENSYTKCLKSWGELHNETLNIYTHLVPAIFLAVFQIFAQLQISSSFPEATILDRVVLGSNMLAAIITFGLSASYHTLNSHSPDVACLWLRIDYVGILTLILGSFFSGIYVGFYTYPTARTVYWTMIALLSAATAFLVLHPRMQDRRYRSLKAYAFTATALTGFAPIGHGIYLYGWEEMWKRSGMPYYFVEGIFYLTGVVFFVSHFPERTWPGTFDIWFHSHQIFHVLVVVAASVHMYGVWQAFAYQYEQARLPITTF